MRLENAIARLPGIVQGVVVQMTIRRPLLGLGPLRQHLRKWKATYRVAHMVFVFDLGLR